MHLRVIVLGFVVSLSVSFIAWSGPQLHYVVVIDPADEYIRVEGTVTELKLHCLDLVLDESVHCGAHFHEMEVAEGSVSRVADGVWRVSTPGDTLDFGYAVDKIVMADPLRTASSKPNDVAVFSDALCAVFIASYLFVYPDLPEINQISLEFEVPDEWTVVCPYPPVAGGHVVERRVGNAIHDFLSDQDIYMGVMQYYSEQSANGTTIRFGRLVADDYPSELRTQQELEEYAQVALKALNRWAEMFGSSPPSEYVLISNFKRDHEGQWLKWNTTAGQNGMQYWSPHRWDEFIGHAYQSWVNFYPVAPLVTERGITKGILEDYYSHKLAWELFRDPVYLAKRYLYYLLYEWMYDHHDCPIEYEYDAYIRWEFIGMLLDETIHERSEGEHSLEEAIHLLYARYAGTGTKATSWALQRAIVEATGVDVSDIYSTYVYWDTKLPVYRYIAEDRAYFVAQAAVLADAHGLDYMRGHLIPWFVNIVMAAALGEHLVFALCGDQYAGDIADHILENYDLDSLTEEDITGVLSERSGVDCSEFFTHWEDSYGRLYLEDVVAWLSDYAEPSRASDADADLPGSDEGSGRTPGFDELGRGSLWGNTGAGEIRWSDALQEGVPVELRIVITDEMLINPAGRPQTTFKVEFHSEEGWGDAIMGVAGHAKRLFSCEYDDAPFPVKYFESVLLRLTEVGENRWEGTVQIAPYRSIIRFTAGEGDDAFGVDVSVIPAG